MKNNKRIVRHGWIVGSTFRFECAVCGCIFEVEYTDASSQPFLDDSDFSMHTRCPECDTWVRILYHRLKDSIVSWLSKG